MFSVPFVDLAPGVRVIYAAGFDKLSEALFDLHGRHPSRQESPSAEGKNGGQFYTPSCVMRCLVEMLAPDKGRIYDPACGSDCFRADDGARWQFGVRFAVSSNN